MGSLDIELMAELFSVLAHPERVQIALELSQGEVDVMTLQVRLGLRQAKVSQHLMRFRQAGLVNVRRQDRHRIYKLRSDAVAAWIIESRGRLGVELGKTRQGPGLGGSWP